MGMIDIDTDWNKIRQHFNKSFRSNFHISIASINKENIPDVTPIGSLFLKNNKTGFYFEKYPKSLPENASYNENVCVMGVNSSSLFWLKSLFTGKFKTFPAVKLYGKLGVKRKATEIEIARLNKRMKATRKLKGNAYLWGEMLYVRDISFSSAKFTELGSMTKDI